MAAVQAFTDEESWRIGLLYSKLGLANRTLHKFRKFPIHKICHAGPALCEECLKGPKGREQHPVLIFLAGLSHSPIQFNLHGVNKEKKHSDLRIRAARIDVVVLGVFENEVQVVIFGLVPLESVTRCVALSNKPASPKSFWKLKVAS